VTTAADLARAALDCHRAKERAIAELARQYDRQVKGAYLCADAGLWAECAAHHNRAGQLAQSIAENEMELAR